MLSSIQLSWAQPYTVPTDPTVEAPSPPPVACLTVHWLSFGGGLVQNVTSNLLRVSILGIEVRGYPGAEVGIGFSVRVAANLTPASSGSPRAFSSE